MLCLFTALILKGLIWAPSTAHSNHFLTNGLDILERTLKNASLIQFVLPKRKHVRVVCSLMKCRAVIIIKILIEDTCVASLIMSSKKS